MKNIERNYTQAGFSFIASIVSQKTGIAEKHVEKAFIKVKKPIPPTIEELASMVVSHVLNVIDQEIPSA